MAQVYFTDAPKYSAGSVRVAIEAVVDIGAKVERATMTTATMTPSARNQVTAQNSKPSGPAVDAKPHTIAHQQSS